MTVAELIWWLQTMPKDALVFAGYQGAVTHLTESPSDNGEHLVYLETSE